MTAVDELTDYGVDLEQLYDHDVACYVATCPHPAVWLSTVWHDGTGTYCHAVTYCAPHRNKIDTAFRMQAAFGGSVTCVDHHTSVHVTWRRL